MVEDKIPNRLDLQYKSTTEQQEQPAPGHTEHIASGPSTLYGRVGDNLTFHTQGAYKRGFFELIPKRFWKEIGGALFGLLRVFLPSRDK